MKPVKLLANLGYGSRKDVTQLIKNGWLTRRDGSTVGVDDEVLGQVVKAFVVATDQPPRAEDRIKAHCRTRLASYKIPRHIVFVDALPRTASGKVRRIQLMEPHTTP